MRTYLIEMNEHQKRLFIRMLDAGKDSLCGDLMNEMPDCSRAVPLENNWEEAKDLVAQLQRTQQGKLFSLV